MISSHPCTTRHATDRPRPTRANPVSVVAMWAASTVLGIAAVAAFGDADRASGAAETGFVGLGAPVRLLDSRTGTSAVAGVGTIDGRFAGGGPIMSNRVLELEVAGRGGLPTTVSAVALNVTSVNAAGPGYVTVYPCGQGRPNASNLNYAVGQVIANSAIVNVDNDGLVCLYARTTTDLIVDVSGRFPGPPPPPPVSTTTTLAEPTTIYNTSFDGAGGAAWGAPWQVLNSAVLSATIDSGRGRLAGQTSHVARVALPLGPVVDAEAVYTIIFENAENQGFGFYMRQNGGALRDTPLWGQGYAVFVEGNGADEIGLWREIDGIEKRFAGVAVPMGLTTGVAYRVRFRVEQAGASTRLRARIWEQGQPEPATWLLDALDNAPALQGTSGAFAVDTYNYSGSSGILIDDITITTLS